MKGKVTIELFDVVGKLLTKKRGNHNHLFVKWQNSDRYS